MFYNEIFLFDATRSIFCYISFCGESVKDEVDNKKDFIVSIF